MDLFTLPSFWAKHQASDADPTKPRVYRLKALSSTSDPEELKSCPVCALRCYMLRTEPRRHGSKRLFLPIPPKTTNIHPNTVSSWIRQVTEYAYTHATSADFTGLQIPCHTPDLFRSAHEVRAISASVAWASGNVSLRSLLQGCHWKSHTVFTDFYLRDLTVETQRGLSLASRVLPGSTPLPQ